MADRGRYLLDTSAILAHMRDEPGADAVQALIDCESADLAITSITIAELLRRLRSLGLAAPQVDRALADYTMLIGEVMLIGPEEAIEADLITTQTPERLPLVDALIAGAARKTGATLVHRDAHMSAIPGTVVTQLPL
jgi:predicted nucleic acid-binding protein